MSYYEGESRSWGIAARIVRERIRALPEFASARTALVAQAIADCRGRSVEEMRALGGFSEVLSRLVAALPSEFRVNVGSKLLPATVAGELVFEIASMRADVQAALADETAAARYFVLHGPYFCNRETFAEFVDALACFRAHYGERPERADLCGATHDGEHDGLTYEERLAVELVQEQVP